MMAGQKGNNMHEFQWKYAKAKAFADTVNEEIEKAEKDYIKNHNIVNDDGVVPEYLWCMDDEEKFDKYNEDFCESISELSNEYLKSKEALHVAEENLINWGLSLVPQSIRDTLSNARNNYKFREKLIDLTFKLEA